MPQPMSPPMRYGWMTPLVTKAAPIGPPLPGCKSGSPTARVTPGRRAVAQSWRTASPSIQFREEAIRRVLVSVMVFMGEEIVGPRTRPKIVVVREASGPGVRRGWQAKGLGTSERPVCLGFGKGGRFGVVEV